MFKKLTKVMLATALAVTMIASSATPVQAAPMKVGVEDLFDAELYAAQNPDVKAAFGNDYKALFNHFMQYGMKEGRLFTTAFNLELYKQQYPDLVAAFGDNWAMYLTHYLTFGINEKRDGGGDFDIVAYMDNNPDVVNAFGFNFKAIKNHYDTFGKAEGRVALSPVKQAIVKAAEAAKKATTVTVTSSTEKKEEKPSSGCGPSTPVITLHEYMKSGDSYYDYTAWQEAIAAWEAEQPVFEDYFNAEAYEAAHDAWAEQAPAREDFIFAYEDADSAAEAFEADHAEWEAAAPVETDFIDEEAFEAAMEEYVAENPEPVVEDYPYFADGYSDEEAARLAYESALSTWTGNAPTSDSYMDTEGYNNAVAAHASQEPQMSNYTYVENTYESADAAAQAYADACTAWTTAKAEALEGLTEGEDAYNTALETFLASNPEPQESEYTYVENQYASEEEAGEAYEEAYLAWQEAEPVENDFFDADAYAQAVETYNSQKPQEDVFQAKVNEYESQDAATQAFNDAHDAWEEAAPVETDFVDEDEYREAMDQYADMEPQEDLYVTVEDMGEGFENTYASQDEADAAYKEAYDEWIDEAPIMDDFAGEFYDDQETWLESQPTVDEFEVEEEDIPAGAEVFEVLG